MTKDAAQLTLTDPLNRWDVTLRTGEELIVWAHSVAEINGDLVFFALMRGQPHFEVEICRIPMAVVADFVGG